MDALLTSPGRYVVAVSGGVDSIVLLHMLHAAGRYELVVAHLDHGIRPDSAKDRHLVALAAKRLKLPFVYEEARLGPGVAEAAARETRYRFLRDARREYGAAAIVTAHHQDDALETAVINLLRGTGRKGLTALAAREGLERPLLHVSKKEILDYARGHGLEWREDSTNNDTDYLRNYVRRLLLPRLDPAARERLLEIVAGLRATNAEIDELLAGRLSEQGVGRGGRIDRAWFIQLPHEVARETMAAWLRGQDVRDFDRGTLERLVVAGKTAAPGKAFDVRRGTSMLVGAKNLALTGAER